MKAEIDAALAILVGQPLSTVWRAVDMAMFGFGPLVETEGRRGKTLISEHWLHIQERWRIVRDGRVQVGSGDWYYPPAGSSVDPHDFEARHAKRTRQDDLAEAWHAHDGGDHVVTEGTGSEAGDLRIVFADGCLLETFVNQASWGKGDELWRLLPPRSQSQDAPHFVVSAGGLGDF